MESLKNVPGVGGDPVMLSRLADPTHPDTFAASKLDWRDADSNLGLLALHRDLLTLRRSDTAFSQRTDRRVDGAVIGDQALLFRFITPEPEYDRLMLINLGRDLSLDVIAEPLLGPRDGFAWQLEWSSEHPDYAGAGRRLADPSKTGWVLPGDCGIVLRLVPHG